MDLGQEESAAASPGASIGPRKKGSYLRDLTTLQTAAAPPWELHSLQARVGRRIKHYARCDKPIRMHSPLHHSSHGACLLHCSSMTCRPISIDSGMAAASLSSMLPV